MGHNISRCLFDNIDSDGDGQQKTLLRACCFNFSKGKEHSDDFIKHPKDTTTQSKKCEIDDDLSRKLFTAVYYGKKKTLVTILRLLVDVDVSSVTWSKGLNSLHVASMRGHLSCVTLLCSVCKFDVDALDELDRTALTWAARNKNIAVYEYLRTKTLLSRLPDVYGIRAAQYLYDNNSEDNSSPTFSLIENCFQKMNNDVTNEQSGSQLSLHTISLCTSPSSSRSSTPLKPPQGRTTGTNSPLSSNDTTTLHSTRPSSLDVMRSFSPPQSPLEDDHYHSYTHQGYEHPWLPNSDKAVAVTVTETTTNTSMEEDGKVKALYHQEIATRRQGSQLIPNLQDIITVDSEENTLCEPEGITAEDGMIPQPPDSSTEDVTLKRPQVDSTSSWTGGVMAFFRQYPTSSAGQYDRQISAGLTENLLPP